MPTIQEVLKQSGWTDEQIAGLDQRAAQGFTQILSTADQEKAAATQAREAAELKERQLKDYVANQINPMLDEYGTKNTNLSAEAAFYKAQADAAKANGFLPADAPGYVAPGAPPRDPASGQYVAGGNQVPGSPDLKQYESKIGQAVFTLSDLQWKYQTLFGRPMPDAPSQLAQEAAAQHLSVVDYAAKKYGFQQKEQEVAQKTRQEEIDRIVNEKVSEHKRQIAERQANPMLAAAESSQFSQIRKAVAEKKQADPLMQSKEERHQSTLAAIQRDLQEKEQVQ
jgi:hypothetical protein